MPTIIVIGSYRIELHTGREWGQPHVHVVHDGQDVLISLITLGELGQVPFRVPQEVRDYIREHAVSLLADWDRYHGS